MMRWGKRLLVILLVTVMMLGSFVGCGSGGSGGNESTSSSDSAAVSSDSETTSGDDAAVQIGEPDAVFGDGGTVLKIVSGSENQELEPILETYANDNDVTIEMSYMGSIDIMRMLGDEEIPVDAVWPASSLWLNAGDENHVIKHTESISITPVVFGIRQSLAEELGFVGRDVSLQDLLTAIEDNKMRF